MKYNYNKLIASFIILILFIISTATLSAQTIQFSFENAQNTNDGSDDYLEADIMVKTVDGMGDFILGSVQMYFNYNPLAFGENIKTSGNFVSTYPAGYILGEAAFAGAFPAYKDFVNNDNTSFRVSMSCQPALAFDFQVAQGLNTMVTSTPKLLYHIKVKYEDFSQDANFSFEDNEDQAGSGGVNDCRDQNYTTCGGASATSDCFNFPGIQIHNAFFDSSGITNAVLSVDDNELNALNIQVYPNPTSGLVEIRGVNDLQSVELFSITGQQVMRIKNLNEKIDMSALQSGVYFMRITTAKGSVIKKIVKQN